MIVFGGWNGRKDVPIVAKFQGMELTVSENRKNATQYLTLDINWPFLTGPRILELQLIADEWTNLGDLKQPRHGHSAVHNGKTVLVIGGSGK